MTTTDMNNQYNDIYTNEDLESMIKQCDHQIQLSEDLKFLEELPQFQRLITTGFLDRNLKDNVRMSTRMTSPENRETSSRIIFAIGYLQDWMDSIRIAGEQAKDTKENIFQYQTEQAQEGEV